MANDRIKGKNIVITGASGGLGEQIAYSCARSGANLALLARNTERLNAIKDHIEKKYSVRCIAISLDVSKYESIPGYFKQIEKELGLIDVLVNNAGYGIFDEVEKASMEDITGMFNVNVLGLIACTKAVIPDMQAKKSGHVINIASQAGKIATPKSGIYSATKHAVLGFTNSLRMEVSVHGVYVTSVNPGPIATNFFTIADKSGEYIKNIDRFMLQPDKLADKIVDSMLTNRREINAPGWMNAGSIFYTLFPKLVEKVGKRAFFKK
ncbi:SDR family NAD(P)-dependent oxidoreductase [Heyndrickxia acidicola]|uniref:SDR family oxidoreductase n=1 Tax=Heyndrickxia acidicola TaxID=209389 RepID=A0ABU6MLK8_9BACI|nr:SDR family oxidoreductase [Heyndrickxia acidicola]MED1205248.1 SDR family oxidoreductase [Heyndrickxia acidicola]